ncbi:hypothetical protein [Phocaeicola coprocola]|jgi:hypothetical protein|uniref:Uncharacterized protein n=1 Tax=Phocaeicola coprocola TaxID=310298 RepID=A0A412GDE7_9BACT|nr:hypothetical protein [Phocaeicola coprocola]RGR92807.1 hypothetical protein DWY20_12265 [Phocaeicola coprocola]
MQPIDKFTNLDAVYYDSDTTKEDIVLDYVWDFAMKIHPAKPMVIDDLILDGSKAIKIFKKRYNERLIEMPLTYKEYKSNQEIQTAISAFGIDVDKFWFALLFIWDYVNGLSWQVYEYKNTPADEIKQLSEIISKYEDNPNANPLTEHITFKQELTLSLQVNGKTVHTINSPNTIKFILLCCQKNQDALEPKDLLDENRDDNIEMTRYYTDKQPTTLSSTKRICLFAKIFRLFFRTTLYVHTQYNPDKKSPYNITFLISQLIYLTEISENEDFLNDKTTLKGYLSKNKNFNWKARNKIYNIY